MRLVVADAGPLIGPARAGRLDLLCQIYTSVVVPGAVAAELDLGGHRPGARALAAAAEAGWLLTHEETPPPLALPASLDEGEAQAIALAVARGLPLLIDEIQGRRAARRVGVRIVGTGGLLVLAKRTGCLDLVAPVLEALRSGGYRLSDALCQEILSLAGEGAGS